MDWGSAVRIGAGGPPHVPPAREVHSIEGTPGYMAPEMAAANGEEIGVRTDVYLLGACLHEILVGTPPHDSESLRDSLCRAFWSSPKTYPADVPEELAAICNKAMSRSPSERHPSAAELKREITIFLRHRHSLASGRKARARAELLEAMLRGAEIDRVAVYKLFGECWFGYENALAQWRANREALVGEARLVQAMVRYEIGRRAIDAACSLMNLLRVPEPELARELPALERALAGEQRTQDKLARLGREVDPDVARRERRRVTILLTVPYGVVLLGLGVCRSLGIARPEWGSLFAVFAGYGLLLFVAITRYRKHLSRTRTNRRFVTHVSLSLLLPVALLVAARATGQSLDFAIATIALLHAGLVSCIALLIHRSLAWSAAPFGAAFVAAAWLPPHALTIVGSAALACAAVLAFQWQRGDHTRALQDMPRGPD
jgi:hypothetical protein